MQKGRKCLRRKGRNEKYEWKWNLFFFHSAFSHSLSVYFVSLHNFLRKARSNIKFPFFSLSILLSLHWNSLYIWAHKTHSHLLDSNKSEKILIFHWTQAFIVFIVNVLLFYFLSLLSCLPKKKKLYHFIER